MQKGSTSSHGFRGSELREVANANDSGYCRRERGVIETPHLKAIAAHAKLSYPLSIGRQKEVSRLVTSGANGGLAWIVKPD
jgi:hypothetical protein